MFTSAASRQVDKGKPGESLALTSIGEEPVSIPEESKDGASTAFVVDE